ncbi:hypothetical protein, partial [Haemophilus sp. SZY H53]
MASWHLAEVGHGLACGASAVSQVKKEGEGVVPSVEAGHASALMSVVGVCEPHPVYGTGSVAEPQKATLDGFRVSASKLGVAGFRVWASKLGVDGLQVWASKPGHDGLPVWASEPGGGSYAKQVDAWRHR